MATDPSQVVVSFDGGETLLYDLSTEQSVTALETQTKDGMFRTQYLIWDIRFFHQEQYHPFKDRLKNEKYMNS